MSRLAAKLRQLLPVESQGPAKRLRVLMIDDDENVRVLVERACTKRGHDLHGVDSQSGALAALQGAGFDLVLVDINLPDTDGASVLRAIRAAGYTIPAIILSGRLERLDRPGLEALGVVASLEKSSDLRPLLQAIEDAGFGQSPD